MTDTARTILEQLGDSRFLAMTGAKNLVNRGNGLSLHLPRNFAKGGIDRVTITLEPSDTYSVAFGKWNARKLAEAKVVAVADVYAEDLRRVFTRETGLDCTLSRN